MKWDKKHAIGVPTLDVQHKQLFASLGRLEQALQEGVRESDVEEIFSLTRQYAVRHFILEEKYMAESRYPGLADQKVAHAFFIERFGKIYHMYKSDGLSPGLVNRLKNELSDWLKEHVAGLDLLFGSYYQDRPQEEMSCQ